MKDTIKQHIEGLLKKRSENLEKVRTLSGEIRKKADEIIKIKRGFGIKKFENEKNLKKRMEKLEFRISTENLPLKVEKELASKIAEIEKRLKTIKEIEEKKTKISEMEKGITEMKKERDKIKKEIDLDMKEVATLRKELKTAAAREAGKFDDFFLGELANMKRNGDSKE